MVGKIKTFIRYSSYIFLMGLAIMLFVMWRDISAGWVIKFALLWLLDGVLMMVAAVAMAVYTLVVKWDKKQKARLIRFAYTFVIMLAIGILADLVREGSWINYSRAVTLAGGGAFGVAFFDLFSKASHDFD